MKTVCQKTVCHILHTLNPGGAEVLATRLARNEYLSSQYRFVFFCLDTRSACTSGSLAQPLLDRGIAVECLDRQPGLDRACMRKIADLWKRYDVSLVHAHQCTPFFYAASARWLHRRPAILLTEHGRFYPDPVNYKNWLFNRLFLARQDRITAVGAATADALVYKEGFPRSRIEVIYNGVDLEDFLPPDADPEYGRVRTEMRARLGISNDDFVVIQVARLDPVKDHFTALAAMARLRNDVPNARLVLVGDGPEREAIGRKIHDLNLDCARNPDGKPAVIMTGSRTDVPELLAAADVFLLTSLSEGIPVTILEAMARQLPVVCTAAGGCGEIITSPDCGGRIVSVGDADALAECLKLYAENRELRIADGRRARLVIQNRFDQNKMHEGYAEIYEQILNPEGEKR